ncbi:MAG: MFS transporter [Clostridia bacterium]|nr:MAG: MFS transporter [Clostridia bacterium]
MSELESPQRLWTRDFVLICVVNFVIFMAFQMLMPTLPVYVGKLGGRESMIGMITGIFTVAAVAVRPWLGLELDRRGRKGIFLTGLAVFVAVAASYQFAGAILWLVLLRVIHGIGWGGSTTAAGTIAADLIPASRRGEGMGYYGLFNNLAMALAPALGLFLINRFGFGELFTTSSLLALLALLLAAAMRVPPAPRGGDAKPALFETRALPPALIMFFITFTWGGVVSFLSLYALEKGIANIGIYFTIYALVLMVVRPVSGVIADRQGPAPVVVPGLILISLAMLVLAGAQNIWWFVLAAVLNGLGFGATQPILQALTINLAPPTRRGAANATFFSAFDLGIGAGSILLGVISQLVGFNRMYLLAALSGPAGLLVFFSQYRRKNMPVQQEL